jgi:hypothetical protein
MHESSRFFFRYDEFPYDDSESEMKYGVWNVLDTDTFLVDVTYRVFNLSFYSDPLYSTQWRAEPSELLRFLIACHKCSNCSGKYIYITSVIRSFVSIYTVCCLFKIYLYLSCSRLVDLRNREMDPTKDYKFIRTWTGNVPIGEYGECSEHELRKRDAKEDAG